MNDKDALAPSRNSQAKRLVKSFSIDRRVYLKFRTRVHGECESRIVEFLILHYLGIPHPEAEGMTDVPTLMPAP